jgi:hypothetical protein
VTLADPVDGLYQVSGQHSYAADGTYSVTITVTDADGAMTSTTSSVIVGDLWAGVPSKMTLTSFSNADPTAVASDFTATVNWGDGTSGTGTVGQSGGVFTIAATHSGGVYHVAVAVADNDGNSLNFTKDVAVVCPPITFFGNSVETTSSGALTNALLGEFTDPNIYDTAAKFSAAINWTGSGSLQAGNISGGNGKFTITGTDTLPVPGEYSFTMAKLSEDGSGDRELQLVAQTAAQAAALGQLEEVKFVMPILVRKDKDGGAYSATWTPTDTKNPLTVASGKTFVITAKILSFSPKVTKVQVIIGTPGYSVPTAVLPMQPDKNDFLNPTFTVQAPATIQFDPKLAIRFEVYDGKWRTIARETANPMYVTYKGPPVPTGLPGQVLPRESTPYETALWLGTMAARGYTASVPEADILNRIWGSGGLAQSRSGGGYGFQWLNITNLDGKPLQYYGQWNLLSKGNAPAGDLLKNFDGDCVEWAMLFRNVLRNQGITEYNGQKIDRIVIDPVQDLKNLRKLIVVGKWSPTVKDGTGGTGGALVGGYEYANQMVTGDVPNKKQGPWALSESKNKYQWVAPELNYDYAPGGQNQSKPPAIFMNHGVVQIGDKWYDPSYGVIYAPNLAKGVPNALTAFYNDALYGFATIKQNQVDGIWYTVFQPKPKLGMVGVPNGVFAVRAAN